MTFSYTTPGSARAALRENTAEPVKTTVSEDSLATVFAKPGGTSLRSQFINLLGKESVFFDYDHNPLVLSAEAAIAE